MNNFKIILFVIAGFYKLNHIRINFFLKERPDGEGNEFA